MASHRVLKPAITSLFLINFQCEKLYENPEHFKLSYFKFKRSLSLRKMVRNGMLRQAFVTLGGSNVLKIIIALNLTLRPA